MNLKGKVAWVTGASTGIGLAGAQALAEAGATVVMSARRREVLEREAAALCKTGARAEVEPLDVADSEKIHLLAKGILARHGRIDILVNSAGLNVPNRTWRNLTIDGWNEVVRTNLDGTFYCVQAVLPAMRAQRDGCIINVSSWAGVHHTTFTGAAYNGSKHAVTALTETINMEEGVNGIRACALCPAEVATPIMERRPIPPSPEDRARMLQPSDLGQTILWIAEQPPHVCVNLVIISPTWNRIYVGGADTAKR
jgi:NAD(P)-dependent dehydrogenase (short-subunit alcohol dehydrogenase family)